MSAKEAIDRLREMQRQIIHGKNTFGEIADLIEQLEADHRRMEHLEKLVKANLTTILDWWELSNLLCLEELEEPDQDPGSLREFVDGLMAKENQ